MDTPEHLRTTKVNKQISDVSTINVEQILKLRRHLQNVEGILDCHNVQKTLLLFSGSEARVLNVLLCSELLLQYGTILTKLGDAPF